MTNSRSPEKYCEEGLSIWECPCHECTRLDWSTLDDDRPTLKAYREQMWPGVDYTNVPGGRRA